MTLGRLCPDSLGGVVVRGERIRSWLSTHRWSVGFGGDENHGWVAILVLMVATYGVLWRLLIETVAFPRSEFERSIVTLTVLRALLTTGPGLLVVGLLALTATVGRSAVAWPWPDSDLGRRTQWFTLIVAGWAAWVTATAGHSALVDQSHDVDRLVLVALTLLIYRRPAFVVPHAVLFLALEQQYRLPFGRQNFANLLVQRLLVLAAVAVIVGLVLRRDVLREQLFVIVSLVAGSYWLAGVHKVQNGWLVDGHPYLGGYASRANGWLAGLPDAEFEQLMEFARLVDPVSRVFTVVVEVVAIFLLFHRRIPVVVVSGLAVLQIGIWAFTGISFAAWIVPMVALVLLFLRRPDAVGLRTGVVPGVVGAVLVATAVFWLRAPSIGWFDTPVVYAYRYEAYSGAHHLGALSPTALALPESFCALDLGFVGDEPMLSVFYGKTNDRSLARQLSSLESGEAVLAFEAEHAVSRHHAADADIFVGDLRRAAQRWNAHGGPTHALSPLAPPRTCLSPWAPDDSVLADHTTPIERIEITQLTYFVGDDGLELLRTRPIASIDVAAPDGTT